MPRLLSQVQLSVHMDTWHSLVSKGKDFSRVHIGIYLIKFSVAFRLYLTVFSSRFSYDYPIRDAFKRCTYVTYILGRFCAALILESCST